MSPCLCSLELLCFALILLSRLFPVIYHHQACAINIFCCLQGQDAVVPAVSQAVPAALPSLRVGTQAYQVQSNVGLHS
jgi:hypothetical protein